MLDSQLWSRRALGTGLLALGFAGCPIAPNFPSDGGIDAGSDDAGVVDGGPGDAGSGSVGATLTPSNASSRSLAWNGAELAGTTVDHVTSAGTEQVTVLGSNATSGTLKLTLSGLVAGTTSYQFVALSYAPASGPDQWTCDTVGNTSCIPQLVVSSFDGRTLAGTFAVSFPADGLQVTAQLSSGTFEVVLP